MEPHTITFFSTPGHGYGRVSLNQLTDLGMQPGDFSACSFRMTSLRITPSDNVLLEEDCDFPLYLAAHVRAFGTLPTITDQYMRADFGPLPALNPNADATYDYRRSRVREAFRTLEPFKQR